jgi:hypothetical protein
LEVGQLHNSASLADFTCLSFKFAAPFSPGPNALFSRLDKALGFRGQTKLQRLLQRFFREGAMSYSKYLEDAAWMKKEKTEWSPKAKLILAFVLGFLALSPAILGIHWEWLLPK